MKRTYLIILMTLITLLVKGQAQDNVFVFDYDGAGNRVKRYLIPGHLRIKNSNAPEHYDQQVNTNMVSIYPNPSRGIMDVKIQNLVVGQQASIKVYSNNGSFIKTYDNASDITTINIEDKPPGNYIISVLIDNKVREWLVQKEN